MTYAEHLIPSRLVCCTWEQSTDAPHEQRVVPDGCVDLIWSEARLTIAGPDRRVRLVALKSGMRLVGARLRPGVAGAALGLPASELCDEAPDATDVLGRDTADALLAAIEAGGDPHAILLRAVEARVRAGRDPDPLVRAAIAALDRPQARVAAVAADLGVSARHLQRRISDAVGYGPKTLQRVLRFRRLQALAPAPLAELALDAGYADQAHMTAEVTRLAGIPPVRFLKDRIPTTA